MSVISKWSAASRLVGSGINSEPPVGAPHGRSIKPARSICVFLGVKFNEGSSLELSILVLEHSNSDSAKSLSSEDIAYIRLFAIEAEVAHEYSPVVGLPSLGATSSIATAVAPLVATLVAPATTTV